MPEIILEHVTKRFVKFVAVDDLNLVIENRGFVTLLGPSGCGKTTTLRMIAGLETPTEGRIFIDGTCVFDSSRGINISPAKRDIGFLFQNYALWPHMTVYDNIAFGLQMLKWDKEAIKKRVDELCELLKIGQFQKRYPSELSGGQQQRVAIARAVVAGPKLILADEPTGNLDSKNGKEVMDLLKELNAEGTTIVMVTHSQKDAAQAQRTIDLFDGQIVSDVKNEL